MKSVFLEWEDPTSIDEWIDIEELVHTPAIIKTLGWLVKEDEKNIYVALNYDYDEDVVSCVTIIPKRYVLHRKDEAIVK